MLYYTEKKIYNIPGVIGKYLKNPGVIGKYKKPWGNRIILKTPGLIGKY